MTVSVKTQIIKAYDTLEAELSQVLAPAIKDLKDCKPVAIPTETVYGLAANALSKEACHRIYEIKSRPSDNPLIVHISSLEMLRLLVPPIPTSPVIPATDPSDTLDTLLIPPALKPVLRKFWPGPLTVLLPRKEGVPDVVTAGLDTVAVRFPHHPIAQKIIELVDFPLAAPSANLSGRPSPTCAAHVVDDLDSRVGIIVDGGSSSFGVESTVLDATRKPPIVLRPGSITVKMLKEYLPDLRVYRKGHEGMMSKEEVDQMEERPATPGMKYRHYSPTSPVMLFYIDGLLDKGEGMAESEIARFIQEELDSGHRIARLTVQPSPIPPLAQSGYYFEFPLSLDADKEEIARNLFAGLRAADAVQPDLIVAQSVHEEDEGLAIMNRLSKAASITRYLSQ